MLFDVRAKSCFSVHDPVIMLAGRKFGEQERSVRVDRGAASRVQLNFPGLFIFLKLIEVNFAQVYDARERILLSMRSYQNVSISWEPCFALIFLDDGFLLGPWKSPFHVSQLKRIPTNIVDLFSAPLSFFLPPDWACNRCTSFLM